MAGLIALPNIASAFDLFPYPREGFKWCWSTSLDGHATKKDRFRDGVQTWKQRGTLPNFQEAGSCTTAGGTRVRYVSIDGKGGTFGIAVGSNTSNFTDIEFDSAEVWHNGTTKPECTEIDFWGVAAHEIGHGLGLAHPNQNGGPTNSPQNQLITMATGIDGYNCPGEEKRHKRRNLSSDDEAGMRYVKDQSYMPNQSFERAEDCIDPLGCDPAFYWNTGGAGTWTRLCNTSVAHEQDCYERLSGGAGTLRQSVRRIMSGQGTFSFWVKNPTLLPAIVRARVVNQTNSTELLNQNCTVPAGGTDSTATWVQCSFTFSGPTFVEKQYQYSIEVDTNPEKILFDLVKVRG